jgi:hypothetical protein
VITEPEAVPEVEPEHVPPEPADVELIDPCRRASFKAIPVTEGPFAGIAFYFVSEPSVTEPSDDTNPSPADSEPQVANSEHGKRRSSLPRRRQVSDQ